MSDLTVISKRTLPPAQYSDLADVPPELEWLGNITIKKTQRAYQVDVAEFMLFSGLHEPTSLRTLTRSHVIAWRKHLELRELSHVSIRRKLSELSSLFCRLQAPFAVRLSETAPMWARAVAPIAEWIARQLWSRPRDSRESGPATRLTQGRKREAQGGPSLPSS